ncbi:hypothetical protein ACIBAI_13380 [Streptomyces sp. NPDC051041]|uniref:hypothetical protein n=1 Tax=Streptomyces sp. NPDC051041 TaxID=3365640 RepID=UPI0037BDAD82
MTEGDAVVGRGVRVRLDGAVTERDIGALRKWLEQEKPLDEMVRAGRLQIHERRRTDHDGTGTPMGVDMEIVVTVLEATVTLVEVTLLVRRAVEAWRANRGRVEGGPPPEHRVDQVGPEPVPDDRRGPEDGDHPPAGRGDE